MIQLVCKCLNIGIHCKENQLISTALKTSTTDGIDNSFYGLNVDQIDDHFFKDTAVLTLALAGITKEHDYLCWTRIVGQWRINHCAICQTDTHAVHINDDNQRRILVNTNLESNVSRIESLRSSTNYSPIFRVILPVKFDNQLLESSPLPVLTSLSSIEATKRALQQRVQRFLSEEQKLMEERIRTNTEQEHNRFADMQLKIGINEDSLYHILDQIGTKFNADSITSRPTDQSLAFSAKQLKIVEKVDPELDFNSYSSLISTKNNVNSKPLDNNKQKKSQPLRYRSQSVDYESVGGVFDIDVEEGNAFDSISYSDEEDEESIAFRNTTNDYNSYNNGRIGRTVPSVVPNAQINAQTNGHMAYSLPIQAQVPNWRAFRDIDIDEDEVPMIPNGETIAESIKKLAKSVRNESDIFGDRPRCRVNTGDLIKSRPI